MNHTIWTDHPKIKPAHMVLVKAAPPKKHNTPMLLLRQGDNAPRLARWCRHGGYVVQGCFGIINQQPQDKWLDISALIETNQKQKT